MRMSFGQHLTQTQTMKLAPRMIQSMEILQLPILALQERIEQELTENPVLEMAEKDPALPDEPAEERENPDTPDIEEKEVIVDEAHDNADDFERLVSMDQEVPDHFDERPSVSANRIAEQGERAHDQMANLVGRGESLYDYLMHQLGEAADTDPQIMLLAERIISTLDPEDGGRFTANLKDLLPPGADDEQLALAETALKLVQSLEPRGIAARDLRECLLLQLTPDMLFYEEMLVLVSNHLEDLRDNRMPQIQKATSLSIEEIQEAWIDLRKLDPLPASEFVERFNPMVKPDVFLERDDDGNYLVRLEDKGIPSLFISPYYRKRLQTGEATAEEKEFIRKKFNAAQWLIESIEQRRSTLTRVAQAIVDHQTRFIEDGPEFIEPLKMQQVADQVGVHVTTVSRAVDDKWMQTPRGILALRRFFVGGTQTAEGEDVAWDKIRIKLQEIIDNEDKAKPYSDDQLVEKLKEEGLTVARRTVTKYRKKMDIGSSRQRRDWSKTRG